MTQFNRIFLVALFCSLCLIGCDDGTNEEPNSPEITDIVDTTILDTATDQNAMINDAFDSVDTAENTQDTAEVDTSSPGPCSENERVLNGSCVSCEPGTTRSAGDNPVGPNTACEPMLCVDDEFVQSNACVPCPAPSTNVAGDDASGPDTTCDGDPCTPIFGRSCAEFEDAYIKASNPDVDDKFGSTVAMDGDILVVSTHEESSSAMVIDGNQADNSAPRSGAAYIFVRDLNGRWDQQAYVKASNAESGDRFGSSVAISGNTVAIGAPTESSGASGIDGNQFDNSTPRSGAVYVFVRDTSGGWNQQAYIKASNPGNDDLFGSALSLDENTLAVGAFGEASQANGINGDQSDNSAPQAGGVYVFERDMNSTWSQQAYIKASNTEDTDQFGIALAIDGDTLAVGAHSEPVKKSSGYGPVA